MDKIFVRDEWFGLMTRGINFFPQDNSVPPFFPFTQLLNSDLKAWYAFAESELSPEQVRKWAIQVTHQHLSHGVQLLSVTGCRYYMHHAPYAEIIKSFEGDAQYLISDERISNLWWGLSRHALTKLVNAATWVRKNIRASMRFVNKQDQMDLALSHEILSNPSHTKRRGILETGVGVTLETLLSPSGIAISDEYKPAFDRNKPIDFDDLKPGRNYPSELRDLVDSALIQAFPKHNKKDLYMLTRVLL